MEKRVTDIVSLTPILSILIGCKTCHMGQTKGISLQNSTQAMNSLQLCGETQTSPPSTFLNGEEQTAAICC